MSKKIALKTGKNNLSVSAYLNSVSSDSARRDGKALAKMFKQITGVTPKMWGASIVGYGEYKYFRSNGDEGSYAATGFSMRKSGPTIYIIPGFENYQSLLDNVGPHKLSKSCLYLKNLQGIDLEVLAELITTGIADLKKTYEVKI